MDFYTINAKAIEKGPKKGTVEVSPDFNVGRSTDLMVRARSVYAIWDEEKGLWSTDEYDVVRLVDQELRQFAKEETEKGGTEHIVKDLFSYNTNSWNVFRKFIQNISDNSHQTG